MNLIVHIGTPKTGTTTLQHMLFNNRDVLRSQGFYFLQCAGPKNNRSIPACCVNDLRTDDFFMRNRLRTPEDRAAFRDDLLSKLHDELSSLGGEIHTVIVSSEQLAERLRTVEEVRRFYAMVSPWFLSIRIVCYLREQCDMAVSLYSTSLRSGGVRSFRDHLKHCTPDNMRYNYYEMLKRWAVVFGEENIDVRIFSKSAFVGGDLICDFFSCISFDLMNVIDRHIPSQNTSIGVAGQRILLMANRFFESRAGRRLKRRKGMRQGVRKMVESRFSGRGAAPSQSEYKRIYDTFYESNRQLNEGYLGNSGALFSFNPPH